MILVQYSFSGLGSGSVLTPGAVEEWRDDPLEDRIEYSLIKGIDKYITEDVEAARLSPDLYSRPIHIIEGPLMKGTLKTE